MPDNGRELLLHGLRDMYDAEHRFAEALGTMADQASDRMLADGFRRHREVTRGQIRRLEQCFMAMGERPQREQCAGAEGLVSEYERFMRKQQPDRKTLDVFAADAALKVEHYEIAAYAGMIDLALRLDVDGCARFLQDNLKEEEAAAAELEMSARRLGAELTGSSAGLRGAVETFRVGSRSGGIGAVGRAVREQATGAIERLEKRGRRVQARSSRSKPARRASRKTTSRRSTTSSASGSTSGRRSTGRARSTATRRPASPTRRPATRAKRATTTRRRTTRSATVRRGTRNRARSAR